MLFAQFAMWEKAEIVWAQAIEVACSIKYWQTSEALLQKLCKLLAQMQQWKLVEIAARSIELEEGKADALRDLSIALAHEQHWEKAVELAISIELMGKRAETLRNLVQILAAIRKYDELLRLVQRLWLRVDTVAYAVELLPLVRELIPLKPEIGIAFYESFTWVDKFLRE